MGKLITKTQRVENALSSLIDRNIIPKDGLFDITESMLNEYIRTYGRMSAATNRKFDRLYARKMAGLWLLKLKLKLERNSDTKLSKEGLVYAISNQAWPEHLKIGMTTDLNKRLSSYQVYDPFQSFQVERYEFVLDRKKTERSILKRFGIHLESGEWIRSIETHPILKAIRIENNLYY